MPERSAIMCVTQIVDEQKVGFLVLKIVFFTVLVQLAGGYNLAAMFHAAPALIRGISELGALLSASLVGCCLAPRCLAMRAIGLAAGGQSFGVRSFTTRWRPWECAWRTTGAHINRPWYYALEQSNP